MIYRVNGREVTEEEFFRNPSREVGEDFAVPGIVNPWPGGTNRYISGAAKFSGDPDGWCGTREEAVEKIKARGMVPFKV